MEGPSTSPPAFPLTPGPTLQSQNTARAHISACTTTSLAPFPSPLTSTVVAQVSGVDSKSLPPQTLSPQPLTSRPPSLHCRRSTKRSSPSRQIHSSFFLNQPATFSSSPPRNPPRAAWLQPSLARPAPPPSTPSPPAKTAALPSHAAPTS